MKGYDGDVACGGTTNKARGCKKWNMREYNFIFEYVVCTIHPTICLLFGFFKTLRIVCEG